MDTRICHILGILIIIYGAITLGHFINITNINISNVVVGEKALLNDIVLGESTENIIWFLQISDLHISVFHDVGRVKDFEEFCSITVEVIKPSVVLASGDLTDAMENNTISSKQFKLEWEVYSNVLNSSGIKNKTFWLDIRGNHDNYDVPSLSSFKNYYQNFSVQGPYHTRSYMHSLKKDSTSVAFIAVDAAQVPGPKRPYNFIGTISSKEMELLKQFAWDAEHFHNYTIWFGHYPTNSMIMPQPRLHKLMEGAYAYLCGHLHTVYGYITQLYTMQSSGFLELELADWKNNRFYRVAAFDNGLFSFIDIPHNTWPLILIINPKNAQFYSEKEPISLIKKSTHIRVLVWSPKNIKKVSYNINSNGWQQLKHIDGPLFTAPWDPRLLANGIHIIEVEAEDIEGTKNSVSQSFSVDGEHVLFKLIPSFLLMHNLSIVFLNMFVIMVSICFFPLCIMKIIHHHFVRKRYHRRFEGNICDMLVRKIWITATVKKLFYPLILACLYVPAGPWFVGEILNGHVGVAFAWGIFVYNKYIPGSLTFLYGFFHMLTFQLPLTIVAALVADRRYNMWFIRGKLNVITTAFYHCIFALIIMNQVNNSYHFYVQYGTMSILIGPLRTWSILFAIYIWYMSTTLRRIDFRSTVLVWNNIITDE